MKAFGGGAKTSAAARAKAEKVILKAKAQPKELDEDTYLQIFRILPFYQGLEENQLLRRIRRLHRRQWIPAIPDQDSYHRLVDLLDLGMKIELEETWLQLLQECAPSFLPLDLLAKLEESRKAALEAEFQQELGEERDFQCRRCRRNRFRKVELQLRSADEGATAITLCVFCATIYKREG
jgi:DNA-directed RNA polymerase subunit M/transcription elongation factor TFIIS